MAGITLLQSTNVVYTEDSDGIDLEFKNYAYAEDTDAAGNMDILSNGFKLRGTVDNANGNGSSYIYMAFAENPFKNSLAR